MLHGPCGSHNGPDEVFGRHNANNMDVSNSSRCVKGEGGLLERLELNEAGAIRLLIQVVA